VATRSAHFRTRLTSSTTSEAASRGLITRFNLILQPNKGGVLCATAAQILASADISNFYASVLAWICGTNGHTDQHLNNGTWVNPSGRGLFSLSRVYVNRLPVARTGGRSPGWQGVGGGPRRTRWPQRGKRASSQGRGGSRPRDGRRHRYRPRGQPQPLPGTTPAAGVQAALALIGACDGRQSVARAHQQRLIGRNVRVREIGHNIRSVQGRCPSLRDDVRLHRLRMIRAGCRHEV